MGNKQLGSMWVLGPPLASFGWETHRHPTCFMGFGQFGYQFFLVGGWAYPSEKWWSSSVGMMKFPKIQYMDSHKIHVPNHQPVLTGWCFDSWRMVFWLRSSPPATNLLNYRLSWPLASLAHAILVANPQSCLGENWHQGVFPSIESMDPCPETVLQLLPELLRFHTEPVTIVARCVKDLQF